MTTTHRSPRGPDRAARQAAEGVELRDYNRIAALTVAVNETLVTSAEVAPREGVLDVATGTGHAALAAARVGASVTGIDYVPALLDIRRARRRRAAGRRLRRRPAEQPAVPRRQLRRRGLGDRRHVRRGPRPSGGRSWCAWSGPAAGSPWRPGPGRASWAGSSGSSVGYVSRRPVPSPRSGGARRTSSPSSSGAGVERVGSSVHTVTQRFTTPRRSPTSS